MIERHAFVVVVFILVIQVFSCLCLLIPRSLTRIVNKRRWSGRVFTVTTDVIIMDQKDASAQFVLEDLIGLSSLG